MKKLSILFAIFVSSLALAVCSCAKKANDGGGKDNLPEISDLIIYENDVEAVLGDVLAIRATDGKNSVKCSWKSSDESIATVDEWGNVTAENVGKATITAAYGKLSATCAVSVTLGGNLPSIETDADDNVTVDLMHEVGVGGEIRFNGKTVDGGKVTYTVADETHKKIHTCCGAAENAAENCSIDRWEVEDESDTALCVCGHEVSVFNKVVTAGRQDLVVTTYTDIDLDTSAANGWYTYTENYNATASIVLTGISDYANVVNIKYGDTILGTAITGFDLSSLTDFTKHGEQNLTVIVKDEYDAEHTIVVPVLFITREIATVTDLMLFVNRKNYTLDGKNPSISGYYRLVNDLIGSTLRDFTASNGNYRNMIFDGNGKTLKLGHWFHYAPGNGLFNIMDRCTVKNLTIDTDYMNKGTPHVVLANDIYGCTFEDITINYIDSVDGGTNADDKGRDFATDECKKDRGFLFSSNVNASTFRNFTINANGKKLGVVIGRMNAWGDGSIKNFIFENFKITNCGGLGAFGWKGKTGEKYMPNDVTGVTVETSTAA